jgi:hypothetical protein
MAKSLFWILFSFLYALPVRSQVPNHLDSLREEIHTGNRQAYLALTTYLDDTTQIAITRRGHFYTTTVAKVAMDIIAATSLLTKDELEFAVQTPQALREFLLHHEHAIHFDPFARQFLITPLHKRDVAYRLYEQQPAITGNADSLLNNIACAECSDPAEFITLYRQRNSKALFVLAGLWYAYDDLYGDKLFSDPYERLFQQLTKTFVQVKDDQGKWVWRYHPGYRDETRLNHLIYWAVHYPDYRWEEEQQQFVNTKESRLAKPKSLDEVPNLFSSNDTTAISAFVRLTNADTSVVDALPVNGQQERINDKLPLFLTNYLSVLTRYRRYCAKNGKSIVLAPRVKKWFAQLKNEALSFQARYTVENTMVKNLTPDEVTAVEYWFLVYAENWEMTYSAGRIIDKFYTFHWKEILNDTLQLKLYLKKAALFDRLGIIGNVNKYLQKFSPLPNKTRRYLQQLVTTEQDADIVQSANEVLQEKKIIYNLSTKSQRDKDKGCFVKNLEKAYRQTLQKDDAFKSAFHQVIACIQYEQIGTVFKLLKRTKRLDKAYDFLHNDFGFPVDATNPGERNEFLRNYQRLSYAQMCEYYLVKLGIQFKDKNGNFDYKKISEILEFDVVDALSGGGGGRREDGVYLLIKLLEIKFGTTLGYPAKLCRGENIYVCHAFDRAWSWIHFLHKKGLAKGLHTPVSISNVKD